MTSLKVRFQRPKKAIKTLKIDLLKRNKHWAWFPQCFPGHLGTKNKNRKKTYGNFHMLLNQNQSNALLD